MIGETRGCLPAASRSDGQNFIDEVDAMKILIAIDGSTFSKPALNAASDIVGARPDVEFKILTAYEAPAPVAAAPFVPMPFYTQEIVDGLRQQAETIADAAGRQLRERFPSSRISTCVVMDEPGSAIVSKAMTWRPDLIIVGSHGHGMIGRVLLGSVSDHVVHHSPCSVMVAKLPPYSTVDWEKVLHQSKFREAGELSLS